LEDNLPHRIEQLYFQQEHSGYLAVPYFHFAKDCFFDYQNEKGEFSFRNPAKKNTFFTMAYESVTA